MQHPAFVPTSPPDAADGPDRPVEPFCFFDVDPAATPPLRWFGPAETLFGGPPPASPADFADAVVPEDHVPLATCLAAVTDPLSCGFRLRAAPDRWMLLHGLPDGTGRLRGWLGIDAARSTEIDLRRSLHEREVLLKELHHRVKNNLQLIVSMISLKTTTIEDPERLGDLQDVLGKVHAVALVQKKIYESRDLVEMQFDEYLTELTDSLKRLNSRKPIELVLTHVPVTVPIARAVPIGLIAHELISGGMSRAPDDQASRMLVDLARTDAGIILTIDQPGVAAAEPGAPSFARQLIIALTRQLNAEITFDPGGDRHALLKFPA
jgi:two-component sensor histidine kinase